MFDYKPLLLSIIFNNSQNYEIPSTESESENSNQKIIEKGKAGNIKTQDVKTSIVTYLSHEEMNTNNIQLLSGYSFCCFYSLFTVLRCLK